MAELSIDSCPSCVKKCRYARRRRTARNIAPSPNSIKGALLPPELLQPPVPPVSPGQHTPAPPPVSSHWKPLGHVLAAGSQLETQYWLVPSLPQLPEAQSVFAVHGEPRPPVEVGPATHTPLSQTWVESEQSEF